MNKLKQDQCGVSQTVKKQILGPRNWMPKVYFLLLPG